MLLLFVKFGSVVTLYTDSLSAGTACPTMGSGRVGKGVASWQCCMRSVVPFPLNWKLFHPAVGWRSLRWEFSPPFLMRSTSNFIQSFCVCLVWKKVMPPLYAPLKPMKHFSVSRNLWIVPQRSALVASKLSAISGCCRSRFALHCHLQAHWCVLRKLQNTLLPSFIIDKPFCARNRNLCSVWTNLPLLILHPTSCSSVLWKPLWCQRIVTEGNKHQA